MNDETRVVLSGLVAGAVAAVGTWLMVQLIPPFFGWYGCSGVLLVWVVGPVAGLAVGIKAGELVAMGVEAGAKRRQEQTRHLNAIRTLCSESLSTFEALPDQLLSAESHLDRAERNFSEHAFSPFWEAIEKAALCLGGFDAAVQRIAANSQQHAELTTRLRSSVPTFPIRAQSVRAMLAANTTNEHMRRIVHDAQRDFQFAVIYEQRRTNHILIAGFSTLGQAIDGLGDRLESSIQDLGKQIEHMSSSVTAVAEAIEAQTTRHDKALVMLDNIQRRRVP